MKSTIPGADEFTSRPMPREELLRQISPALPLHQAGDCLEARVIGAGAVDPLARQDRTLNIHRHRLDLRSTEIDANSEHWNPVVSPHWEQGLIKTSAVSTSSAAEPIDSGRGTPPRRIAPCRKQS